MTNKELSTLLKEASKITSQEEIRYCKIPKIFFDRYYDLSKGYENTTYLGAIAIHKISSGKFHLTMSSLPKDKEDNLTSTSLLLNNGELDSLIKKLIKCKDSVVD